MIWRLCFASLLVLCLVARFLDKAMHCIDQANTHRQLLLAVQKEVAREEELVLLFFSRLDMRHGLNARDLTLSF